MISLEKLNFFYLMNRYSKGEIPAEEVWECKMKQAGSGERVYLES